jgi:hypothetical protein
MASSSKSSVVLPWLEGLQLSCQSRALLPLTDVLQSLSILASSSSCILAAVKKAPSLHCFVALQDITFASPGEGVAQLQELEEVQLRVVEALCTKEHGQQAVIVSCRRALRTILYHYNTTRVECSDAKKETLFSDCYSIDKNCCLWSNSMTTLCRENHPQLRTFVFFLPKCNFCICAN